MTGGMMFKDWDSPPDAVWVWGKYKKYGEVYCHSEEIKQQEFEIPVTRYVRDDLAKAAPELLEALIVAEKEMVVLYKGIAPNGEFADRSEAVKLSRAAIAKALGEQK